MASPRKSPQQKKRLSLERDRRNAYGENAKSSRKNIPRSKALGIRAERHGQDQALRGALRAATDDDMVKAEVAASTPDRGRWGKTADRPLGEVVERHLEQRIENAGARARRRADRRERNG